MGAPFAWLLQVPQRIVASVMAFGAGVLISALAFDLVDEAETTGGLTATVLGFLVGAVAYVLANVALAKRGARHRKRSGDQQPTEDEQAGSGSAIAIGALLDGIPESVVLGLSLLGGNGVGVPVLVAIFISNLPEGLSSAAGMKHGGRSAPATCSASGSGSPSPADAAGLLGCLAAPGSTRRRSSPPSPHSPPERS